ncbi:CHAT domain-containing protein [Rhizobium sp. PvP099]|uniref:CHAT domain-containing protein n=1 Tax=unclassified Rhizobium TaxID=2613769 RepID=UPI0032AEA338
MTIDGGENTGGSESSSNSLEAFYKQNGIDFGAGDLFCIGGGNLLPRLKEYVGVLGRFFNDDGHTAFSRIFVVAPPGSASALTDYEAVVNHKVSESSIRSQDEKEKSPWLHVRETVDLRVGSIWSALADIDSRCGIVILDAARYRESGSFPEVADFNLKEDAWVPSTHAICCDLVKLADDTQSYFVVDTGELKPGRERNLDLLMSLEKVGFVSAEGADNGEALLAARLQAWDQYLAAGTLGPVLNEIEALPLKPEEKAFFRIQMLHRAGLHGQALGEIDQFATDPDLSPLVHCKLARIATDAGATFLAAHLLRAALEGQPSVEGLAMAIDIATEISERYLEERAALQLERLFPEHPALINRLLKQFDDADDYTGLSNLWERLGNAEARDLCLTLAGLMPAEGLADYRGIRKTLVQRFNSFHVDSLLVRHARRRKLYMHALDIATTGTVERPTAAHAILNIVEDLTLSRDEQGRLVISGDQLKDAIEKVISYLAENPTDTYIRSRLAKILSLEITGTMGVALIAVLSLDFMRRPLTPIAIDRPKGLSADQLSTRLDLIGNAWKWLDSQSPVMLGKVVLPEHLLTVPADDLAPAIITMMKYLIGRVQDDDDLKQLRLWMMLGVSINPHTTAKDYDLDVLRLGAAAFAMTGQVQFARDIAEQILNLSDNSPRRRRTGWFSVADIYQRLGNKMESLIAFACAAAGDTEVEGDKIWDETNGLVRLLRDTGLFDAAREIHESAWNILGRLGLAEANAYRHRFMLLTIDLGQARLKDDFTSDLPAFLHRATECAEEELQSARNVEPQAILLAQLILWAQLAEVEVPVRTIEAFELLLDQASGMVARLARSLSSAEPEPEALLNLHQTTEAARYADDVAHDARFVALLSQRLLASDRAQSDAVTSTFAIEMISDRAVPAPGWKVTSKPLCMVTGIDEPAAIAKSLSLEGFSVILLGADAKKHLTHVQWRGGEGSIEPVDAFSVTDFRAWSENLPYEYGIDDETPNLFYTTTESLRLTCLPAGPIVVVADTELQQLPCNILRVGDGFAGESHPMASAPSLSWLKAARENPAETDGRKIAWISQEEKLGQTFVAIKTRLADTFEEYGIELDIGPEIPDGLAGSELVIVTAHGGLGSDQKYFQRVSDEGSLVMSGGALAAHLRNVGVVVLFVCSGGRTDKVPDAVTTIGLAKSLLDQGCTAVLASPWPLDSRVTYHWLPAFLDSWTQGSSLAEANFQANQAVARGLGGEPAKCLAMTLYGDPLRTCLQADIVLD